MTLRKHERDREKERKRESTAVIKFFSREYRVMENLRESRPLRVIGGTIGKNRQELEDITHAHTYPLAQSHAPAHTHTSPSRRDNGVRHP